jgi:hypothetical protein
MQLTAKIISWISLVVLTAPALLYLAGRISSLDQVKMIMSVSTVVWFVSAPVWMGNEKK